MNNYSITKNYKFLIFLVWACLALSHAQAQFSSNVYFCNGGNVKLSLNLATPAKSKAAVPGIILIHGGSWAMGDKKELNNTAIALAYQGYVAATVDYRLSLTYPVPNTGTNGYLSVGAKFPDPLQDVKCAVRWMRANSKLLGVDPNKIVAFGQSAGAHLALLLRFTDGNPAYEGKGGYAGVSSSVNSIIDWFGPTDLNSSYFYTSQTISSEYAFYLFSQFMGGTPFSMPYSYYKASPINLIKTDSKHTLVVHGTADTTIPIQQSIDLVQKLQQFRNDVVFHPIPGAKHGFHQPSVNSEAFRVSVEFLKNLYK